ncbi:hypothetical protein HDV00_008448 [Rhizophlyctis rosea]|nr:hypothetical protein HDV00_008448 [Rhizophlyctis rosea]
MEVLLDELLSLRGRPQYARAGEMAREGIRLASVRGSQGGSISLTGPNDGQASDFLAAAILIGGVSGLQELRIDILADLVQSRLRAAPDATATLIIYAFFLAGSQPDEAIETITKATNATDFVKDDKIMSRLLMMRGWAEGMRKGSPPAEPADADFASAIRLDPHNLGALRLHARTSMTLKRHATAVGDLNRYLQVVEEENLADMPGFAAAWYDLVEALFRRGPKAEGVGGIPGLLQQMQDAFEKGREVESRYEKGSSEESEASAAANRVGFARDYPRNTTGQLIRTTQAQSPSKALKLSPNGTTPASPSGSSPSPTKAPSLRGLTVVTSNLGTEEVRPEGRQCRAYLKDGKTRCKNLDTSTGNGYCAVPGHQEQRLVAETPAGATPVSASPNKVKGNQCKGFMKDGVTRCTNLDTDTGNGFCAIPSHQEQRTSPDKRSPTKSSPSPTKPLASPLPTTPTRQTSPTKLPTTRPSSAPRKSLFPRTSGGEEAATLYDEEEDAPNAQSYTVDDFRNGSSFRGSYTVKTKDALQPITLDSTSELHAIISAATTRTRVYYGTSKKLPFHRFKAHFASGYRGKFYFVEVQNMAVAQKELPDEGLGVFNVKPQPATEESGYVYTIVGYRAGYEV